MIPNNIELGPGEIYICDPDSGKCMKFGSASETSCTTEEPDFWEVGDRLIMLSSEMETAFSAVARISKDGLATILGLTQIVLECCPNRRVVHLARYAKKYRTRKKNLHRAFRILEKENG